MLTHSATARHVQVLTVFHQALAPFRDVGFGLIPDQKPKAVLARCDAELGPGPG